MKRMALCGLCAMALLAGCAESPDELRTRGTGEFQVGHMTLAKGLFQQVLDRYPSDPESLYYMGRIRHAEGDLLDAIRYYQCAIDSDPSLLEARRWLAKAEQEAGTAGKGLRFIP